MIYHCYKDQQKNIISELEKQKSSFVVRSYDRYGYIVAWEKSVFSRSIGDGMVTYSPLQELELVKYSYLIEDDSDLRQLLLSKKALKFCKKKNYLDSRLDIQKISIILLYKLIYLYQLSQEIDGE